MLLQAGALQRVMGVRLLGEACPLRAGVVRHAQRVPRRRWAMPVVGARAWLRVGVRDGGSANVLLQAGALQRVMGVRVMPVVATRAWSPHAGGRGRG